MSKKLIKVSRGTTSRSFALETSDALDQTRSALTDPPKSFMTESDAFLNEGSPIARGSEPLIPLSSLSGTKNAITIGTGADLGGNDSVQRYNQMSESSKRALFDNIQIRRGLTFDDSGQFKKTFKDLYDWKHRSLPEANMPRVLTEVHQSSTFNQQSHTLETSGVDKSTVSLNLPWGSSKTDFSYAESHSRSDEAVQQFMTERYLSNKVDLNVPYTNLEGAQGFIDEVKRAVRDHENSVDGYANLVGVLNEWGWYIPLRFTLGGAIYGTRASRVQKYTQVESNTRSFGSDFKATFDGIGGGTAYSNSDSSTVKRSGSGGQANVQLLQIGGRAGTANDYQKWNQSLEPAVNWNSIKFERLLPSLLLLVGRANEALTTADQLLQKYHSYPTVRDLQPHIDVGMYELRLASLLNPFD